MSEPSPRMLTLSTRSLSADGARVTPGDGVANTEMTEAAVLATLQAFARVPAVELVDVEAKIYLSGPRGKFAVQNIRGKLFAARVPEAVNTATEFSPEQIIMLLTEADPTSVAAVAAKTAAEEAELIAEVEKIPTGPRALINSIWTIGCLAIALGVLAYVSFAPETPEGVEISRDPARIVRLHSELNGRYGNPAATVLLLTDGHLTGGSASPDGQVKEVAIDFGYRYGQRGDDVVVVVDNGALLEVQPDHSLNFLDSAYPRLNK